MRAVTVIPATINRFTSENINTQRKRRTAAYARVSTDSDEQQTSYEAQVDYYTSYINSRDDWQFVDCYTDEGISATSTAKREGFNRMVADALAGKIDLIVTKSVSRFARNTVDSLSTIRKLKEHGTEVYFEKENIWTFDGKGELLITIMSSLAQEESRSISENCTWGQRKRFSDGKVCVPYSRFLGYDKGENDTLKVNEKEAVIVRKIYRMFLEGGTPHFIAKSLTAESIPTPGGKQKWSQSTVKSILTNEKYKGDALLQKGYTTNYLTKKKKINEGEIPQYYVENAHGHIIEPTVFDMVQREFEKRRASNSRYSGVGIFASRIKCGECGSWYGAKVWHSNSKYRRTVYQCNSKFKGAKKCETPHFDEETIKLLFVSAVNKLISDRNGIIQEFQLIKDEVFDTTILETQRAKLSGELIIITETMQKAISENARIALDQAEYQKHYASLSEQYEIVKTQYEQVESSITDKNTRKTAMQVFIAELQKCDGLITEFNERLWFGLVEFIAVDNEAGVNVIFKDGTEIKAE